MIRIAMLDTSNYTTEQQLEKLYDNTLKLCDAVDVGESKNISVECLAVIQSAMGILLSSVTKDVDLIRHLLRHELETKCREASGGDKILGWLNIDYKDGY
jgi:hypothetical protein